MAAKTRNSFDIFHLIIYKRDSKCLKKNLFFPIIFKMLKTRIFEIAPTIRKCSFRYPSKNGLNEFPDKVQINIYILFHLRQTV